MVPGGVELAKLHFRSADEQTGQDGKECSMKSWQLLSGPILALLAGGPASAADDSHCTSVTDSAARLACYDAAHALHPNTAAVPATRSPASSSKPVAPTAEPAPAAQATFGLPPKVDQRKEARRLTATVVSLQNVPVGQVFTLDNGQVWQIGDYLREPYVRVHDAVVITRQTLGSFLMVRASGGDSVRVKRLR